MLKDNRKVRLGQYDASSNDILKQYMQEMVQEPLLTAELELLLAQKIEQGRQAAELLCENQLCPSAQAAYKNKVDAGQKAFDRFVKANTRLVVNLAKRYWNRGLSFLDLIQEGNIGLICAVEKFDYRLGNRFSTYATWWIRQALNKAVSNYGQSISLPVDMKRRAISLQRKQHELEETLGRRPSANEIAHAMNLKPKQVNVLLTATKTTVSLDQPVEPSAEANLAELIADQACMEPIETVAHKMLSAEIESLLGHLAPKEAHVIELRFGLHNHEPLTLTEAGKVIGLSRERVRQLERNALRKMRSPLIGGDIYQYLWK